MRCPTCDGEMKALLTSTYCPKDCDRRVVISQRMLSSKLYEALKQHFGDFIYAPKRQVEFVSTLVEVKPMETPNGLLFHMDISYDFKYAKDDSATGTGPRHAGDSSMSGGLDRILPKRRI